MCRLLPSQELSPGELVGWFRGVDRSLLLQGWRNRAFRTPSACSCTCCAASRCAGTRAGVGRRAQAAFLTCLYLAYSYMGNEISLPAQALPSWSPTRSASGNAACASSSGSSPQMLRLNADPTSSRRSSRPQERGRGLRQRREGYTQRGWRRDPSLTPSSSAARDSCAAGAKHWTMNLDR